MHTRFDRPDPVCSTPHSSNPRWFTVGSISRSSNAALGSTNVPYRPSRARCGRIDRSHAVNLLTVGNGSYGLTSRPCRCGTWLKRSAADARAMSPASGRKRSRPSDSRLSARFPSDQTGSSQYRISEREIIVKEGEFRLHARSSASRPQLSLLLMVARKCGTGRPSMKRNVISRQRMPSERPICWYRNLAPDST